MILKVGQVNGFAKVVADVSAKYRPADYDKYDPGTGNWDWLVAVDDFKGGVVYWRISLGFDGATFVTPTNAACEEAVNGPMYTAYSVEDELLWLGSGFATYPLGLVFEASSPVRGLGGLEQAFALAAGRVGVSYNRLDSSSVSTTISLKIGTFEVPVSAIKLRRSTSAAARVQVFALTMTATEFQTLAHALNELSHAVLEARLDE